MQLRQIEYNRAVSQATMDTSTAIHQLVDTDNERDEAVLGSTGSSVESMDGVVVFDGSHCLNGQRIVRRRQMPSLPAMEALF